MLQADKKSRILESLDFIRRSYLKLALLKEREQDAQEEGHYDALYELSENERILIEDINDCLKFIIPDLLSLRRDGDVNSLLEQIDGLHEIVITQALQVRSGLEIRMHDTEQRIKNLDMFPQLPPSPVDPILNIRA
jgi:hypothetical protein